MEPVTTSHTRVKKVILIAGASSGIGRAAAVALAARGHTVFGTSRDPSRVDMPGVTPLALEVGDDTSVSTCIEAVVRSAGRLDAVIYSAGFYVAGAAEETSTALATAQFDAYVIGAHRLVRSALPIMRRQGGGRIVLMSSTAAVAAIPFHAIYSASKAALEHYAEGLAYEVAPFGVGITCLQGTGVRTGAAGAVREAEEKIAAYEPARSRVLQSFRNQQTQGPPPQAFVSTLVHVVETKRLAPRYRVGRLAKLLPALRLLLPWPLFRRFFAAYFAA